MSTDVSLAQLQAWFVHAMTHGETAGDGTHEASTRLALPPLDGLLTRSDPRTAEERFAVYHHGYRARLVECLLDDYPVLAATVGDRFEALCHHYIARHPSRSFSLNRYGQALAPMLREDAAAPPFLAELAELEWALVEAIHAPGGSTLGLDAVSAVPPAAWEHAVLEPAPSLTVHAFEHPVNAYYKRVREAAPDDEVPTVPSPQASAVAICRRDTTIWRVDLSPSGHAALRALATGTPLLAALTAAEARPEDVSTWFRTWMECGFFRAIRQTRA